MKFVHGKRMIKQEQVWGFVLVTERAAGVRTFGLILGTRVWGYQWKIKTEKSKSGSARTSRRSSPNTDSK